MAVIFDAGGSLPGPGGPPDAPGGHHVSNKQRAIGTGSEEARRDAIAPTLYPDDSGDRVANLQSAFEFLLESDVNLFFAPEGLPSVDELKAIWQALRVEASAGVFDKTTRALTYAFQQRQGLSPQSRGVVDRVTAEALNARLRQLGALGDETSDHLVKGRITTTVAAHGLA